MSRNRVIYQSEALFVSKDVESTGKRDHMQLRRIQSADYSFNVTRTDLNQFGQLSRIDSLILEAPSVSADISYYLGDGYNEEALNFANSDLNVGFVSGQIESTSGQNLYIATAPDGKDANFGSNTGFTTIGIGNAFVTDYSLEASVGGFPTVTVSFEGSNINASAGISGSPDGFSGKITGAGIDPVSGTPLPSQIYANGTVTDPQVLRLGTGIEIRPADPGTDVGTPSALRPSDIFFDLTSANGDTISDIDNTNGCHVQSVSLSIPLSRTPIERLGTRFPFARTVDFPITPTLSVSAILSEVEEKSLTTIVDSDDFIPDATITIKDGTADNNNAAVYKLTNLKLDSESFSSSVGPNKTVDLTFSVSVGGPDDTVNNIFFSGANTDEKFALKRIQLSSNLESDETVKINGVSFTPTDQGPKTVGYMHGQSERVFKVNYTGDANLNIGNIIGGTITGFVSADDRTADTADGIANASGAAGGFLEFKPDLDTTAGATFGLYDNTGTNSEETITGIITQS